MAPPTRLLYRARDGTIRLSPPRVGSSFEVTPYAILSHTWQSDEDEVVLQDIGRSKAREKAGYAKIRFCVDQATKDGIPYSWVDSCCIEKASSAELQEAITAMFSWYRNAQKCYVYLSDVSWTEKDAAGQSLPPYAWEPAFRRSRWFTRGWTLQELLAPSSLEFYSAECVRLGDKQSLESIIHAITRIPVQALRGADMSTFDMFERLSWAANRNTKRREDRAYSMLGICNVFMPLIYGEGDNAWDRLLRAIEKNLKKNAERIREMSSFVRDLPVESPTTIHSTSAVASSNSLDDDEVSALKDRIEELERQVKLKSAKIESLEQQRKEGNWENNRGTGLSERGPPATQILDTQLSDEEVVEIIVKMRESIAQFSIDYFQDIDSKRRPESRKDADLWPLQHLHEDLGTNRISRANLEACWGSDTTRPAIIQWFLWTVFWRDVHFELGWAPSKIISAVVRVDNLIDMAHGGARYNIWRAATCNLLTDALSQDKGRGAEIHRSLVKQLVQHIMWRLSRLTADWYEKQIVAMSRAISTIIGEYIEIDKRLSKQVVQWDGGIASKTGQLCRKFVPREMEGQWSLDYGLFREGDVVLLAAPGLFKKGGKNGEDFGDAVPVLKSQVVPYTPSLAEPSRSKDHREIQAR